MTDMRRISLVIPDELDRRILALRADDKYAKLTYSEIIRRLLDSAIQDLPTRSNTQTSA